MRRVMRFTVAGGRQQRYRSAVRRAAASRRRHERTAGIIARLERPLGARGADSMAKKIEDGTVVSFHYTLTADSGDTLDSTRDRGEPMLYLHGANNIITGLEKALDGREAGESFQVTVPPLSVPPAFALPPR